MRRLITALTLALMPSSALAHEPIPQEQWTDGAKVWLARGLVSEASWHPPDHAAIAWVLGRQWAARFSRDSSWTFEAQVRRYCAGLRHDKPKNKKGAWVYGLTESGEQPESWDQSLSWEPYRVRWLGVLKMVEDWAAGSVKDPCKGRAHHWGGAMDRPSSGLRPVNCGMTLNIFYGPR